MPLEYSLFLQAIDNQSIFIMKPEAKAQGRGIYLINKQEDIITLQNTIAQYYINDPLIINELKFDLRIYAVVIGCDPLKIFINKEGIARFATENYQKPCKNNLEQRCMHLTNYAVNKTNKNFIQSKGIKDDQGHKRALSYILNVTLT